MAQANSYFHRQRVAASSGSLLPTTSFDLSTNNRGRIGAIPKKIASFLTQAPVVDKWEEGEKSFRVRSNINPQHSGVHVLVTDSRKKNREKENDSAGERNHEYKEGDPKCKRSSSSSSSSSCRGSSSFTSVSSNAVPIIDAMCNGTFFELQEFEDCNKRDPVGPFHRDDLVSGCVIIAVKDGWTHNGVYLTILGQVTFPQTQSNPFVDRLLEPEKAHRHETQHLYQKQKHLQSMLPPKIRMIELCIPLLPKGKLAYGVHQIPFSFPLEPCANMFEDRSSLRKENQSELELYETFHGDQIRIDYNLHVCIDRGVFLRPIDSRAEIKVETPVIVARRNDCAGNPLNLTLSSADIFYPRNSMYAPDGESSIMTLRSDPSEKLERQKDFSFSLDITLRSKVLDLDDPFIRGSLALQRCEGTVIKSGSISLKRVESFFFGHDSSKILNEDESIVAWSKVGTLSGCQSAGEDQSVAFEMKIPELQVAPCFNFTPCNNRTQHGVTVDGNPMIGFEVKYFVEFLVKLDCGRRAVRSVPIHVVRSA